MHPPGRSGTSASVECLLPDLSTTELRLMKRLAELVPFWAIMRALQSLHRDPETSALSGLILVRPQLSESNVIQQEAKKMLHTFVCPQLKSVCFFFFFFLSLYNHLPLSCPSSLIDCEVIVGATSIWSPRRRSDDEPVESAHPKLINKACRPITLTQHSHKEPRKS